MNQSQSKFQPSIVYRHPDGRPEWRIDPWTRLSFFQNSELLAERFFARHGLDLDSRRSVTIASHIAQGKDYFASAATAGSLAQPLLLYYGVLALSRALILFATPPVELPINTKGNEKRHRGGHGLTEMGWDEMLDREPETPNLMDLAVLASKTGTFRDLITAIDNQEWTMIRWEIAGPRIESHSRRGGYMGWVAELPKPPEKWCFTFGDVVSRIPDLVALFEESMNRMGACFPVGIVLGRGPFNLGPDVEAYTSEIKARVYRNHLPFVFDSDEKIDLGVTLSQAAQPLGSFSQWQDFTQKIDRTDDPADLVPHIRFNSRMGTHLVTSWPDGSDLSTLPTLFAASYCIGMLVRYHPTSWHYANSVQYGNRALPLLRELSSLILDQYPLEIVEVMERKVLKSGDMWELPSRLDV